MLHGIGHQLELLEQKLLLGLIDQGNHRVGAVIGHDDQTLLGVLGIGHEDDVWLRI
ncbi:MAG: hypothetical protein ACK46L_07170 [Synechococcaceae cyanobacterium]